MKIGASAGQQLSFTKTQDVFIQNICSAMSVNLFYHVLDSSVNKPLIQAEAVQHSTCLPSSSQMSDSLISALYYTTLPVLGHVQKTHQFRCSLTLKWSQDTLVYTSTGIMAKLKDAGMSIDLGRQDWTPTGWVHVTFLCVSSFISCTEPIHVKGHSSPTTIAQWRCWRFKKDRTVRGHDFFYSWARSFWWQGKVTQMYWHSPFKNVIK